MKTALLFTANDPQLAAARLMLNTLRAPDRGAYEQDIWVLSTALSEQARQALDNEGIRYLVSDMNWADKAIKWRNLFPSQPEPKALAAFHDYRNKRMSKLIYLEWFEAFGQDYDAVAVCDNDLYFQEPIAPLFAQATDDCIHYTPEDYPMVPGSALWIKDARYRQITEDWSYNGGQHEVNIGFITARPTVMRDLFQQIKDRFATLPVRLIRDHNWHDQDLARVIRSTSPEMFVTFPEDSILHLCGGGMDVIEERRPGSFINRITGATPRIVHFGGGAWKNFPSIAPAYRLSAQDLFDDINQRPLVPSQIAVSNAIYLAKDRQLKVNGWYLSETADVSVTVAGTSLGVLGSAKCDLPRPDVARRFPGTLEHCGGWELTLPLQRLPKDEKLIVSLIIHDRRVSRQTPISWE